jgi:gliding motility-associated-like protein
MKKFFLPLFALLALSAGAQCVRITSIFVNSCTIGTGTGFCDSEGYNEMFTFEVGASDLNVSDIVVTWPNNSFQGWCTNALTALKTDSLNNTIISSCGYLKEPVGGVIPAGANVIALTSENICVNANSFEGLTDTMYIIYQCNGVSTGYFANNLSSGQTRTLTVNVSGSCTGSASATYDSTIPVVDGATALFDEFGNVSYVVNGCNAPVITQNPFWSFTTNICHDFGDIDLNTLLSFNATQGGVWSGAGVSGSIFNPSGLFGETSITYTISGAGVCTDLSDSTIIFSVDTIVIESQLAQSCDSVFVNGVWYYDDTFISYTVASLIPFACETRFEVTVDVTDVDIDSTYIFACDSALVNGNWFYADTIIRDTIPGSGGGSVQTDTILFTGFENDEGWQNYTTVASGTWTNTNDDGDWIGYDMYANGGDTYNGSRKIGFNTLGDWFQLPPVDNPVSMTYYMRLSSAPTGTHEMTIQYFDGTNWVDIQVNIIVSTTYVQITVDLSSISSLTGVLLRMFVSQRGNRSFFVDDLLVEGLLPPEPATCDQINIFTIEIAPRPEFDTINLCSNDPALQGIITDTLSSLAGCDSLITTTITTFVPTTTNTFNQCTNNPALAGTTIDTVFSSLGCDSIYNETITVLVLATTNSINFCTNDPALAGTVTDTVLSVLGCDSIYNETITTLINPVTVFEDFCTNDPLLAGIQRDTVHSILGCDSIYNERVTTLVTRVTNTFNQCTNNPALAGTTIDTVFSSLGCDSIYNETITVLVLATTNSINFCTNDPALAGTVTDTVLSVLGCDSIYNETITTLINPVTVFEDFCTNDPLLAGIQRDTVHSILGCDSIYNERVTTLVTRVTNTFNQCTNNPALAGTTIDTVFSSLGCDSIYNETITVLVLTTTNSINFCTNDPALAGTVTDTVLSVLGCDSIYNETITTLINPVTVFEDFCTNDPLLAGIQRDTVLSVLGCDSIYNERVTTLVTPVANTFNQCTNNPALAGTTIDTVFSSLGCDSIYNETITVLVLTTTNSINFCTNDPALAGTVTDTVLSVLGCDSIYNQTITTLLNTAVNTTNQCTNDPALTGTVTDTVFSILGCDSIYNTVVTTFVPVVSLNFSTCTNNISDSGIFNDTLFSQQGCDSIYIELVVNYIQPQTDIVLQSCTNVFSDAGLLYTDTIFSQQGCDSLYLANEVNYVESTITETFLEGCDSVVVGSDVYYQNFSSSNVILSSLGCDSIVEVFTVNVYSSPVAFAGNDITITRGQSVQLSGSGGVSYFWQWNTGNASGAVIEVAPLETTQYILTAEQGICADSDTITVSVIELPGEIFIPDAFTPNGDGINDVFEIVNPEQLENISMHIYNRWGELIFRGEGLGHGWDGTYKGELQNPGVYVYFITAMLGDDKFVAKGSVTLIR